MIPLLTLQKKKRQEGIVPCTPPAKPDKDKSKDSF